MEEDPTLSVSPNEETDLDVSYRDDGTTVTLADRATETVGTTVAVGTSGEFQPSYNDDGTFTVEIDEAADATIAVSSSTDDADWSVTDDGVDMGLADGVVTVDRGADELQMGTDDGTITLTMGEGHTPERSSTNANGNDAATSNETNAQPSDRKRRCSILRTGPVGQQRVPRVRRQRTRIAGTGRHRHTVLRVRRRERTSTPQKWNRFYRHDEQRRDEQRQQRRDERGHRQ